MSTGFVLDVQHKTTLDNAKIKMILRILYICTGNLYFGCNVCFVGLYHIGNHGIMEEVCFSRSLRD